MNIPKINADETKGGVYRLWYADKYLLVKCKTLKGSAYFLTSDLNRYLQYNSKKHEHGAFTREFFDFIRNHPGNELECEVLFTSDKPYQLLKREQEELDKARGDSRCMNVNFDAYIPKKIQGTRKSWINRGHYLNFCIWKRKREQKTTV